MYHFCTYFDRNYLTRGMALYGSFVEHCRDPFVLWVLCLDAETHTALSKLGLEHVRLIPMDRFEREIPELARAKRNRGIIEYYWTCTPLLPLYIFERNPEVDSVVYLDADLQFFSDFRPVWEEFGDASILLVKHRYASGFERWAQEEGVFNVGLMIFRRDCSGLLALRWWRDRCLEWERGADVRKRFSDQVYLDDWPSRFEGVAVLQHKGAGLAPWNFGRYVVKWPGGRATVNGGPLVFYHFHGYRRLNEHVSRPMGVSYCECFKGVDMCGLYLKYHATLRLAERRLRRLGVGTYTKRDKGFECQEGVLKGLLGLELLLTGPRWVSMMLWDAARRRRTRVREMTASRNTGFGAYRAGNLPVARRHLLSAIRAYPPIAFDPPVLSILMESWLGRGQMARLRRWWRALRGASHT